MSEWRLITEDEPAQGEDVNLWPDKLGDTTTGERKAYGFIDHLDIDADGCPERIDPTHWMPLPHPPE